MAVFCSVLQDRIYFQVGFTTTTFLFFPTNKMKQLEETVADLPFTLKTKVQRSIFYRSIYLGFLDVVAQCRVTPATLIRVVSRLWRQDSESGRWEVKLPDGEAFQGRTVFGGDIRVEWGWWGLADGNLFSNWYGEVLAIEHGFTWWIAKW